MLEDILAQQLYGGNGWRIVEVRHNLVRGSVIEVYLQPTTQSAVCSGCGETKRCALDTKRKARRWRHLDAWNVQTEIIAPLRRVRCRW